MHKIANAGVSVEGIRARPGRSRFKKGKLKVQMDFYNTSGENVFHCKTYINTGSRPKIMRGQTRLVAGIIKTKPLPLPAYKSCTLTVLEIE